MAFAAARRATAVFSCRLVGGPDTHSAVWRMIATRRQVMRSKIVFDANFDGEWLPELDSNQ